MTLDPIALTERFVASAFPNATIAVMAGSTAPIYWTIWATPRTLRRRM